MLVYIHTVFLRFNHEQDSCNEVILEDTVLCAFRCIQVDEHSWDILKQAKLSGQLLQQIVL